MKSFTRDLIAWIENNLDKRIGLEEVAAKSGYSKWYLQRMFRQDTGMKLATYIRARRLSETAILLKMTRLPVIDAAEQYGFSNQQAFTRTFTRHFCQPPVRYRQARDWHLHGLQPSLLSPPDAELRPELVSLHLLPSSDVKFTYLCDRENLNCAAFHTAQREKGLKKAVRLLSGGAPEWFTEGFEPAETVGYTRFTLSFGCYSANDVSAKSDPIMPRKFLRFPFEGNSEELTLLQIRAYQHILPHRDEARQNGTDLFIMRPDSQGELLSPRFRGDYYVPVTDCLSIYNDVQ